jgi:hypothetical protein
MFEPLLLVPKELKPTDALVGVTDQTGCPSTPPRSFRAAQWDSPRQAGMSWSLKPQLPRATALASPSVGSKAGRRSEQLGGPPACAAGLSSRIQGREIPGLPFEVTTAAKKQCGLFC